MLSTLLPSPSCLPQFAAEINARCFITIGILELLNELDADLNLKCNKFYIGFEKGGQALNFVTIKPLKKILNLNISILRSDEADTVLDEASVDTLEYQPKWSRYRRRLSKQEIKFKRETIKAICKLAYERRTS